MVGRYSSYRRGPDPVVNPNIIDRVMIGACAAIWLVLVGVSVAAAVALADLGRGFHKMARTPHTTWVLYAVIVVSALIIAGAVPVLLRARRMTQSEPVVRSRALQGGAVRPIKQAGRSGSRIPIEQSRREQVKAYGALDEWSGEVVDRIWLRGALALTSAIGTSLIAVAVATYLMAAGHDGASWVSYGFAGVIAAGLPAIEILYVRQLRRGQVAH
ncbi:DUF2561 domain-containing protein [Mycobacterium paragordonae]|jgi:hypothetical protein|uniref:Rhodanese domain-containing protein n=1 Tax=Mycobacterium paragordonae TaxID=1389713 RepID=A0ABQ1C6I1_9MYCO|nr:MULTISPECIES: DUF2561 family protein [Mycobacterium]AYE96441.1 DUF2561 domain-containing protein [Mycobacterium paragordonae]OBJ82501.1 hypothetical protein A9W97_23730 [Mycobacterium gordonae]OBK62997.1 hypothetical protein A5656_09920 [Mycobacterium gordonae]TDK99313.1 DUF2561 family protein [Mycobacterium paragordonae]GFG79892.1 hypothetical protein MPRG_31680 [Mycobacterium paragordonae]